MGYSFSPSLCRLAASSSAAAGLTVKLLYVAVCLLPLGWVVGCLPPLDALLPWTMELVLTRLMGGSQMATDLRYHHSPYSTLYILQCVTT